MKTQWKEFGPGNQYRVSDQGKVETRASRNGKGPVTKDWRPKAAHFCRTDKWKGGYYTTVLRTGSGKRIFYIHRLVCQLFIGDIPKGMHVNHIDGDTSNNALLNLEICTPMYNMKNALSRNAFKNSRRSLHKHMDEFKVLAAITLMNVGYKDSELGKVFGVARANFNKLRNKKDVYKPFHSLVGGAA